MSNISDFCVAPVFQDGVIFAKNLPIRIFGNGDSDVDVLLAGHSAHARRTSAGWLAELPSMNPGGPYELVVSSKETTVTIHDVHVGIVLMVSGQSNMQFRLSMSTSPESVRTDDGLLRSFSMPRIENGEPFGPKDGWVKSTRQNAGDWSAIGYLIGRELRERTGEAIGIINCYQGASSIIAWLPKDLASKPAYILPADAWHGDHSFMPYATWNKWGLLYDLDILMLAPFSISGIVWYQGESNTGTGDSLIYPQLAVDLVHTWRLAFMDPKMPFIMVQLADFVLRKDGAWKAVQDGQMMIPSLVDNVTVVKCADICEDTNIHPPTKAPLAHRIVEELLHLTTIA